MIRLLRLYSTPQKFTPITFTDGVNLILGEKVSPEKTKTRKDRKTNGVGKSMSIEFINFCLLKDEKSSRVMKIPFDKFPDDVKIKLDIQINNKRITIVRSKAEANKPIIETEDKLIPFSSADDARIYLQDLFYEEDITDKKDRPSFRELLGPLIRDEDSEFGDILSCYDLRQRISPVDLVKPHLYFFNISISLVESIKEIIKKIGDRSKTFNYLKDRLTDGGKKKLSSIKAELNALERELESAGQALDDFKSDPIFQQNQEEVVKLETDIESLRTKQVALRFELKRIENMPRVEVIDTADVQIVYEKFKNGLGHLVSKSIDEVFEFKKRIEKYQKSLIDEKAEQIRKEMASLLTNITDLDDKRSRLLKKLDTGGLLKDLKSGFSLYVQRKEELNTVVGNYNEYEALDRVIKSLKVKKTNLFSQLDASIFERDTEIRSFNQTLTSMHEYIMGNAKLSFDIKSLDSPTSKQIIRFDLRIADDGSRSVDRTKVFMYDIGLMLNEFTHRRHPLFLVHDNIFDVDQDTLVQSLNYLAEQEEKGSDFQYILTLNRDKIENEEKSKDIKLDIDSHTRAKFTRQSTFLGTEYQEVEF